RGELGVEDHDLAPALEAQGGEPSRRQDPRRLEGRIAGQRHRHLMAEESQRLGERSHSLGRVGLDDVGSELGADQQDIHGRLPNSTTRLRRTAPDRAIPRHTAPWDAEIPSIRLSAWYPPPARGRAPPPRCPSPPFRARVRPAQSPPRRSPAPRLSLEPPSAREPSEPRASPPPIPHGPARRKSRRSPRGPAL